MITSTHKRHLFDHYTNERKKALDYLRPLGRNADFNLKYMDSWEYFYMELCGDFTPKFFKKLYDEINNLISQKEGGEIG